MKFENNNKEVIKRITNRSLKTNKIRNIFSILAIVLTTFMISTVFSIGISFVKNYKTMNLRIQGTTASVSLENPTEAQINKIRDLNLASDIGYEINAGRVVLDTLTENRTKINIKYSSEDNFKNQITPAISSIEGKYPTEENEIMASRKALEFLGKSDAEIGDKIEVNCNINGNVVNEEFVLDGIYRTYDVIQDKGYLLVSEKFINAKKLDLQENGTLHITLKNKGKSMASDILTKEVALNDNQEFSYNYDITDNMSDTAFATAGVAITVVLFIILSGYLLIYNILYIAVNKDINFYGVLKTIGTSPKQIKKIVKGQALKLSLIAIPIGLILGALVSFGVVPIAMSTLLSSSEGSAMPSNVSFNPIIFIASALFSLLTVVISCRKPAKIAGNISPTEAMSYTGARAKKQKKTRKSTNGGEIYIMAWYNVFREKKRSIIVFLSLFMGIITFLSVNTFLGSISVENYIDGYVRNDFTIQNVDAKENKIDDEFIEKIKYIEGIKRVDVTSTSFIQLEMNNEILLPLFKESYESLGISEDLDLFLEAIKEKPSLLTASVMGISDDLIEKVNEESKDKIDVEAFKRGELILLDSWYYGENYRDIKGYLTFKNNNTNEEAKIEAILFNNITGKLPEGPSTPLGIPTIYMNTSALEAFDNSVVNYIVDINVDKKYEPKINSKLKDMTSNRALLFESKSEITDDFNKSQMVMNILGGGISIILILIGILNFINIMITGVNVRLKELAVMESIGMTKKQIKKMLTFEGLYYAGITTTLILTVGMAIIYGVAKITMKIADYAVFVFPGRQLILLTIVIFIVCLSTPSIVFKILSKKSVTERVREIED